jgi:hypothetical protein
MPLVSLGSIALVAAGYAAVMFKLGARMAGAIRLQRHPL